MSEGKRPGGLTALAVLNFVGGGFLTLAVLGNVGMLLGHPALLKQAQERGDEKAVEALQAFADLDKTPFVVTIVLLTLAVALLIVSGVGYLKQRRFLGRILGSAWAGLAILATVYSLLSIKEGAGGGGVTLGVILMLIYPVLTLILLNGTFKEDFTR